MILEGFTDENYGNLPWIAEAGLINDGQGRRSYIKDDETRERHLIKLFNEHGFGLKFEG